MTQPKFRTIPKQASTLMEALTKALERLATLEVRVDRIEIHQRTQQVVESNNEYGLYNLEAY